MKLPKLPKTFFSVLGPIEVADLVAPPPEAGDAVGLYKYVERRIEIEPKMAPEARWSTLWHEAVHVALNDSGVQNVLTKDQAEAVCDAVGGYLAAMMRAGRLRVTG